jgi:LuxR family transcriptional regulator, maltose regulon positive regulatory protein
VSRVPVPKGKITVPRLPKEFVPRPALRERLDRAGPHDLILVSAPAGYGKSLLLADWAAHHPLRTAWVTVDTGDNDPRRLWTAVSAALAQSAAISADRQIQRWWRDLEGARSVDDLLEALDDLEQPVWLVLDDLHEITAAATLADIARMVRWRPGMLRPVVASRVDPPLALPRLRLESRLCEIRVDQLRFTGAEAAALLRGSGRELRPEQTEALVVRTEGWAAGLRLAAVALRDADDPDRFLAEFSGNERSVADYLAEEMMASLDPPSFDFLRAVSVCSPQFDELAKHLSGRPDAGVVLDRLAHLTGLIEVGRSGSYRIHALLRSYLLANLERRSPAWHQELHVRAAEWWAARQEAAHALRHGERAGDDGLLIGLIHRFAVGMIVRSEHRAVTGALAAVSAAARATDPMLILISAAVHLRGYALPRVETALQQARGLMPTPRPARLAALVESVELANSRYADGVRVHQDVVPEALPPEYRGLLHHCRCLWGIGHPHARDEAQRDGLEALRIARTHGYDYLEVRSRTALGMLAWARGERATAERYAKEIIAAHNARPAWTALGAAMLAYGQLLGGDPTGARRRADVALQSRRVPSPETDFLLYTVQAAALSDLGDPVAGLRESRAARIRLGNAPCLREFLAAAGVLEHRSALLIGNRSAADTASDWLERRVGSTAEVLLTRALSDRITGDLDSSSAVALESIADGRTVALLPETRVEALVLRAGIAFDDGGNGVARRLLESAVTQGRRLGAVRPFAFVDEPTRRELRRLREQQPGTDDFLERIAAVSAVSRPAVPLQISAREADVLALLPSLMSAREIAEELGVSHNTVKTHVRSIYAKLGVSRRREAVRRAQERGLLR